MIVGDDDDAGVLFVGDLAEQLHHLSAANAVQSGGGFIGENQAGAVGQRPGYRDPLLLPAR